MWGLVEGVLGDWTDVGDLCGDGAVRVGRIEGLNVSASHAAAGSHGWLYQKNWMSGPPGRRARCVQFAPTTCRLYPFGAEPLMLYPSCDKFRRGTRKQAVPCFVLFG